MGVDAHHAEADRTYRLLSDHRASTYSTVSFARFWDASPAEQRELASRLPEAVPAIEQATNSEILSNPICIKTKDGRAFHRRNGRAVECSVALPCHGLHRSPTRASPPL